MTMSLCNPVNTAREGQCGLCRHFHELPFDAVVDADPAARIGTCNHPAHVRWGLQVSAISRCDGFALRRGWKDEVQQASEQSFPASDPPAWTGVTSSSSGDSPA